MGEAKVCAPPERITLQKFTDMISGIELKNWTLDKKCHFYFYYQGISIFFSIIELVIIDSNWFFALPDIWRPRQPLLSPPPCYGPGLSINNYALGLKVMGWQKYFKKMRDIIYGLRGHSNNRWHFLALNRHTHSHLTCDIFHFFTNDF